MKKTVILCLVAVIITGTAAFAAGAGTQENPVVTLDYLENVFLPKIEGLINEKTAGTDFTPTGDFEDFTVIEVKAGKTFRGDAGCEFILRMGTAQVVATAKGGVSDVTAGNDLANDALVPGNHHLIVPVNDGRGFKAFSDVLVMVKGKYQLID